ncbi:MAG: virulence factor [Hyphomicrobiales bacterium]|nr:virulence factor [Hyphomicrobiales bacterium]
MASLTVLYWRDIPSEVIVRSGRQAAKRELSERFIRAIDAAAMHAKARSADDYLAEWRKSAPAACGDDLEAEAEAAAARLEAEYDTHRLALLAKHDGRESPA